MKLKRLSSIPIFLLPSYLDHYLQKFYGECLAVGCLVSAQTGNKFVSCVGVVRICLLSVSLLNGNNFLGKKDVLFCLHMGF